MFWKKTKNTELDDYIMDLEDRVRNLKRRIREANHKMGFDDRLKKTEPQIYVRHSDPPRSDLNDIKAKLLGRR
tara:strand:- start:5730 stop:5948 length:219 start_codon:yes stop_codon:yes gene_type:complete